MGGNSLEERIDRLESIEAVRLLKHTYCKMCDNGYDAEGLASLFWEDGIWDAGPQFGRYIGPTEIASFFRGVSASIVWARHLVTNERIEVNVAENTASGEFEIIQPCTFIQGEREQAAWLIGHYSEQYRRKQTEWKYQSLTAHIDFITPYEKGWHVAQSLDKP